MSAGSSPFFVTGGTLRHDAPSYVERQADRDLLDGLLKGEFCYVLTSRQMGKSSLMVRAATKLREQGANAVVLDLTAVGQNLTPEQWYDGLMVRMGRQLGLEEVLENYWRDHPRESPVQRFFSALRDVLLAQRRGPVVLFVDELDVVRSLPFSTDEFFAAIRECYNRRTLDSEFDRLTFCLLGVASPSDLIRDTRITPFNIGRRIELNDFNAAEAAGLAQGLGRVARVASVLLDRVLYWTHGHPYLTQRLCLAIADAPDVTGPAGVDRVCEALFLSSHARERDDNLLFVRDRLLRSDADRASLLTLYDEVRHRKIVRADETNPLISLLRLSGIVRLVEGYLWIRNRIYFRVFDRKWIRSNMPDAELRRQQQAFRRGVVRAAAVAALIIATMTGLVLYAREQASRARQERERVVQANQRLQEALNLLRLQKAEDLFKVGKSGPALAQLAFVLRQDPTNRVAAERILAALTQRSFALPVLPPLKHSGAVWSAHFSPDGQRVLTGSQDNTARLWDARTGQALGDPLPHESPVRSVEYSRNGSWLLTLTDRRVRIWDAKTGLLARELTRPGRGFSSAQFSPDGHRVLTLDGSDEEKRRWGYYQAEQVFIWDTQTSQPLIGPIEKVFEIPTFESAQFSPDGGRFLVSSVNGEHRIWAVATGQPLTKVFSGGGSLSSVEFSPDGLSVFAGHYGSFGAHLYDAQTGRRRFPPLEHPANVPCVAISPDAQRVATGCRDGAARIWDAQSGSLLAGPMRHDSEVYRVQFSPEGERLATVSSDRTARLWDGRTGQPLIEPVRSAEGFRAIEFSPDGQWLLTVSGDAAQLWDARLGRQLTDAYRRDAQAEDRHLSPDGLRRIRLVTRGGHVSAEILDARTDRPLTNRLSHVEDVQSARFSPDGRRVATTSGNWSQFFAKGTARVWDADSGEPLTPGMAHEELVLDARFSADGDWLVTASRDGTARVWNSRTGQPRTGPLKHERELKAAVFSPDGKRVVTASEDGTAAIWDASTGRRLAILRHDGIVYDARFNRDGTRVVTSSEDKTARLWDGTSGQPLADLRHEGAVRQARFSPDGQRVVTASEDMTARIWDVQTGQALSEPLVHTNAVFSAEFTSDGHRVVTSDSEHSLVWDVLMEPVPAPVWLSELAEAVAGERLNEAALFEQTSCEQTLRWRSQLTASGAADLHFQWSRWFFADRATRTTSPFSPTPVPEYIHRQGEVNSIDGLRSLLHLSPTNGPALARLGLALSEMPGGDTPGRSAEMAWLMRRAAGFAPEQSEVWRVRAKVMENQGDLSGALQSAEGALARDPLDPECWHLKGTLLERANRLEEACDAYGQALNRAGTNEASATLRSAILLRRSDLHRRLKRHAESQADYAGVVELDFTTASKCNDMAWRLVTGSEDNRDPERALLLAEKAVRLAPKVWAYANTLGVAHYRNGQFEKAVKTLQDAAPLASSGKRALDLLVVAMAYRQLGDAGKARDSFAGALHEMEQHSGDLASETLRDFNAFRAEAEKVLGVQKP